MSLQLSLLTLATVVVWVVELQTKVREDFTITEMALNRAFSITIKNLLRYYMLNWRLNNGY